jgi:predicted DNA-binding transcriptional regulator YafY
MYLYPFVNNRPNIPTMPKQYFNRLQNIDRLIRVKGTGSPKQLAARLHISESLLYEYLSFMKEQGAPIAYCKDRRSYYYETQGGFNLRFINNT